MLATCISRAPDRQSHSRRPCAADQQHRAHRNSVKRQRNGRGKGAPCHHRGGKRNQHQQRLVEQNRRVGRQPPQRHQRDEQRRGDRSAVGARRRSVGVLRPPGEEPEAKRQDREEHAGEAGALQGQVIMQNTPHGTQFRCDERDLRVRRAESPQRQFLQLQPLRPDAVPLRGDDRAQVVYACLQRDGAVEQGQQGVAVFPVAGNRAFHLDVDRSRTFEDRRGNALLLEERQPFMPRSGVGFERVAVALEAPDDGSEIVDDGRCGATQRPQSAIEIDRLHRLGRRLGVCGKRIDFRLQRADPLREITRCRGFLEARQYGSLQLFAGEDLRDRIGDGRCCYRLGRRRSGGRCVRRAAAPWHELQQGGKHQRRQPARATQGATDYRCRQLRPAMPIVIARQPPRPQLQKAWGEFARRRPSADA